MYVARQVVTCGSSKYEIYRGPKGIVIHGLTTATYTSFVDGTVTVESSLAAALDKIE